jgi:hypothetical protein
MENDKIKAYWQNDVYAYILEKVSKKGVELYMYSDKETKYVVGASVLQSNLTNSIILGAGVVNDWDKVDEDSNTFVSVRGYWSLKMVKNVENIGDTCFLLPKLYTPKKLSKRKYGIFVEDDFLQSKEKDNLIDYNKTIENLIDSICRCEKIFSEDLVILAIAQSYDIPNLWITSSYYYSEIQFQDLFSVTDIDYKKLKPVHIENINDFNDYPVENKRNCLDVESLFDNIRCYFDDSKPVLSILICTLDERLNQFNYLYNKLKRQVDSGYSKSVEILYHRDNRLMKVGDKRNSLINNAKGKYVCFIDDDDDVSDDYISVLIKGCNENKDCVGMVGQITINGQSPKQFVHSLRYNEYFEKDNVYYRPPNHLNPIKKNIAKQFMFDKINYGEDTDWAMRICKSKILKTESFFDKPIYFYKFVDKKYN